MTITRSRPLIITGVLLISAIITLFLNINRAALLLLALVGILTILVFLRWPPLGLMTLIVASQVIPFGIGTGTYTNINIAILLLVLLFSLYLFTVIIRKEQLKLSNSRLILPLLIFTIVIFVSFGMGQLPWFSYIPGAPLTAQLGGLAIFLLSFITFILVGQQVRDIRWLKVLTWTFLAIGGIYVLGWFIPRLGQLTVTIYQRGANVSLFWVWIVSLAFSQFVLNRQMNLKGRLLLGVLVLISIYVVLFPLRSWVSGWLPALVAVFVIVITGIPRSRIPTAILSGVIALVFAPNIAGFVMIGDNPYSLTTRVEAWRILAEIIKANPIFGLGPANYYWYTSLFHILGYSVVFNSHNNYVDIIAQTGILGLACFLWFAWEVGRLGWRLRIQVPDGFARAFVYGCLGGLTGTLVAGMLGDWVIPFVYNIGMNGFRASMLAWLFLGGLVALEQIYGTSGKNNQSIASAKS